ncbi:uncharacterized protein TRIADDRAFT_58793 [Trichoplax adhaerens]|uniref:Amino acid transporter transmembrane domain-containing protein n=1 Tax=Trichoplax adhaerens TaxID=10228 RepID=B3S3P1_TRIAD|nr:hypothetical protein TRIADDRAFT_58793 [Trichoplax adhaerens]EDV22312.1 hypothetical protein TRIADDRAFT_58793 [Trichoplax adhaerens]|eukprot:XP_002114856.1 hypothetical protein TRIADDRAFT_58793 [Trichoplax adhaerens]
MATKSQSSEISNPPSQFTNLYANGYYMSENVVGSPGAIPDVIAHSGIPPLIVSFAINAIMQGSLLFAFMTLIQQARIILFANIDIYQSKGKNNDEELPMLPPISLQEIDEKNEEDQSAVNCSSIGGIFLPTIGQYMFSILVVFILMGALVADTLGASQSLASVMKIKPIYVVPFFLWLSAILPIIFVRFFYLSLPILILIKYILVITIIIGALCAGNKINIEPHTDWKYIGSPMLFITCTLGAYEILSPFVFVHIKLTKKEIVAEVRCVSYGRSANYVKRIIISAGDKIFSSNHYWAYAVLRIVPQTCQDVPHSWDSQFSIADNSTHPNCNISLAWAHREGVVCAIPMLRIVRAYYPEYDWIAVLSAITLFLMMTLSYICNTLTMANVIAGIIMSSQEKLWGKIQYKHDENTTQSYIRKDIYSITGYLIITTLIFLAAFFNPRAFIIILQYGMTTANNIIGGILVPIMVIRSYFSLARHLAIPVPMNIASYILFGISTLFFLSQLIYAIVALAS